MHSTCARLHGHILMVTERDGGTASVTLAPDAELNILVKRSLADIKPGDFVASTGSRARTARSMRSKPASFPKAHPDGGGNSPWDLGRTA